MINSLGSLFWRWMKAPRKAGFAQRLASFDPMYKRFHPTRSQIGDRDLISPATFAIWENADWPDPRGSRRFDRVSISRDLIEEQLLG